MRSVTLKSAMTPSFIGLMATMLPGVPPGISFASLPTASTSPVVLLIATMEGSLTTMPLPLAKTRVLAVPRSIARSDEKRLNRERRFIGGFQVAVFDLWRKENLLIREYHNRFTRINEENLVAFYFQ